MDQGQDSNNLNNAQPETTPEISVDLANPGQANGQANSFLNPQIPSSDTIMPPSQPAPPPVQAAPAPAPQVESMDSPLQANIPPTMPSAEAPKQQIAWDRVALVGAGVIVLIAAGAFFLLGNKQPAATPTPTTTPTEQPVAKALTPTDLVQHNAEGVEIDAGGSYKLGKVTLEFDITNATGTDVIPEIELQPMGTAFTGTATSKGQAATAVEGSSNLHASVVVDSLTDGAYHWQARATQAGESGDWVPYGSDVSAADFTIDTVAPGSPTVASIDSVAVTTGQTVKTTSNRPTFTGKADPSSTVVIEVKPEGIKMTANADTSGNWSATASTDIPNGNHDVVVTSSDSAGNSVSATVALGVNTDTASSPAVAATTPDSTLAETGEATNTVTLIALCILVLSIGGLITANRHGHS